MHMTFNLPLRLLKRCGHSRVTLPSFCLGWGSLAPACSLFLFLPARLPMAWPRHSIGRRLLRPSRLTPSAFMPSQLPQQSGFALNFTPFDPIQLLIWSAVLNGIVAVPTMIVMMLLVTRPSIIDLPLRCL
jgi:hypothetical protein